MSANYFFLSFRNRKFLFKTDSRIFKEISSTKGFDYNLQIVKQIYFLYMLNTLLKHKLMLFLYNCICLSLIFLLEFSLFFNAFFLSESQFVIDNKFHASAFVLYSPKQVVRCRAMINEQVLSLPKERGPCSSSLAPHCSQKRVRGGGGILSLPKDGKLLNFQRRGGQNWFSYLAKLSCINFQSQVLYTKKLVLKIQMLILMMKSFLLYFSLLFLKLIHFILFL